MGDVSEMMMDGTLCATCGGYIMEGDALGFPRYCEICKRLNPQKVECPTCGKRVRRVGLEDHGRAVHGGGK